MKSTTVLYLLFSIILLQFICQINLICPHDYIIDEESNAYSTSGAAKIANSESPLIWKYFTDDQVYSVAFSGDGKYLASGGDLTYGQLFFFSTTDSLPLWNCTLGDRIRSVAISETGRFLVAGSDNHRLYYFDTTNSTPMWSYLAGYGVNTVAISSNGEFIVGCSGDDNIFFFHNTSSTPEWIYDTGDNAGSLDMSTDGKYIVGGNDGGKIFLWERSSSMPLWNYSENGAIMALSISSDGNYITSTNYDYSNGNNYIHLFHRSSSTPLWSYSLGAAFVLRDCLKISADGNYILAGTRGEGIAGIEGKGIFVFHRNSNIPIWTNSSTNYWWEGVDISSDGCVFAVSPGGFISLYERSHISPKWIYQINDAYHSIAISPDGRLIAGGFQDGYVYLLNGTIGDCPLFVNNQIPGYPLILPLFIIISISLFYIKKRIRILKNLNNF